MSTKTKTRPVVATQLPVIREGQFVTLSPLSSNVPDHLKGQQAVVTLAHINEKPGDDDFSPRPYEYQAPDAVFDVRSRDTRETVTNLTREDFSEVATFGRVELTGSG